MAGWKGKAAERDVAAMLQAWWSHVEPAVRFVRTPQSGGWHEPSVRAEFRACGDVMTTAESFPWAVEVKRRERWSLAWLLGGRPSPVWAWWRQTVTDAETAGLHPMLWLRRSREPWRVMLGEADPAVAHIPRRYRRPILDTALVEASALLALDPAILTP